MSVQKEVVPTLVQKSQNMAYDEDAIFVERICSGDRLAFEHIYGKYYEKVFAIAKGVLLNTEEAADAVQEIFTLVYKNISRFDRRARFSTWLFRISVNRSIQEARKNRNKYRLVELNEALAKAVQEGDDSVDPKIHRSMARLQPADRAALVLYYWEELSLEELAQSLGCTPNAAKTRLYRARERFRSLYEEVSK
ncbi:MAG TPA: sigma-70 family RNA polymerase sigma factor [Fimbriimonadaceae bacterium]|jgi:RNA polymerase sigma-70 factor (ECF subfamily)